MNRGEQKARAERMAAMWRAGNSATEIASAFGVQNPAVYKALRATGDLPPYRKRQGPTRRTERMVKERRALLPIVDRDPCSRCGTRADIGCAHSRVPPSQRQGLAHNEGAR